jgi:hypothetical protein
MVKPPSFEFWSYMQLRWSIFIPQFQKIFIPAKQSLDTAPCQLPLTFLLMEHCQEANRHPPHFSPLIVPAGIDHARDDSTIGETQILTSR